jgi:DNA-binding winged helix-turn-helix (wHTH) protein
VKDMTESPAARRYRFGAFEADATTGELRRQGIRIKLNAQPFQVLLALLERPGELLTREQIARELWPDGTFVDYEHGLNSAVNRIREALGDTAGSPRFVETLARRGYRFVAPVERIGLTADPTPSEPELMPASLPEQLAAPPEPEPGLFSAILATPEELPKTSHSVVQTLFVLLQLMYVGFYVGALANLPEIEELFRPLPRETQIVTVLVVTAAILILVRAFLISAAFLRPPRAREKLLRMWPFLLPLDILWALSPFLLLHHISVGLALACMTLLVYSPFAQRSLILMGAGGVLHEASATAR